MAKRIQGTALTNLLVTLVGIMGSVIIALVLLGAQNQNATNAEIKAELRLIRTALQENQTQTFKIMRNIDRRVTILETKADP